MMPRLKSAFRAILGDRAANAAVEFAILMPILLLLIAGTVDLGLGFQQKLKLQSAVNSGLQHVMQTQGADIATTKLVITHGLGPDSSALVEATTFCRCGTTPASCSSPCPAGSARFAAASASQAYNSPLFDLEMNLSAHFEIYLGRPN